MATKADALYARYSSHQQDEGTSIEVQIESCERAAGGPLLHYIDRAKTGRTKGGRTELLRLIRDAEEGKIGRLFVYKFDRLGRAAETHLLIEDLETCGVEVASATEGTNTLARGVQLVVAADFSRALAERTRAGLIKRHESGHHIGGVAPYGFKVIATPDGKKKLAINEAEADAVRTIYDLYINQGQGLKNIGQELERRRIPTRLGGPWRFTTIRGIITNRMLVGEVVYLRRTFKLDRSTGRRVPRANDASQHLVQIDNGLRVVDDETFKCAQAKLAANRGNYMPRPRNQVRAFTRLLFCSECGNVCYARKSKNAKGVYYYYGCSCRQCKGPQACANARNIREDFLKERVMAALGDMFLDAEQMIAEAVALAERQINNHREDANRLKGEIAALDDQIGGYMPLLLDRDIEPLAKKAISRQIASAQAKQDQMRAALDDAVEQTGQSAADLADACRQAFREAREAFAEAATDSDFNRLVEMAVGPMALLPDGRVVQKETTTDEGGRLAGSVAGARFVRD